MANIREIEEEQANDPLKETYQKLAMRCSFGIINAGRNSA
jgi:phosphoenolpyruvate carboxylase